MNNPLIWQLLKFTLLPLTQQKKEFYEFYDQIQITIERILKQDAHTVGDWNDKVGINKENLAGL